MKCPSAKAIADFYREWKLATGYAQAPDAEALSILSAGKRSLIECVLSRAREASWSYGVLKDDKAHNEFNDVFYVDTPHGQVSFHIRPGELGDIPAYSGKWSEMYTSDIILAKISTEAGPPKGD